MRAAQDIGAQSPTGITYAPRPGSTPEAELSALAAIYKLCISHANRNVAGVPNDSGMRLKNTEEVSDVEQ